MKGKQLSPFWRARKIYGTVFRILLSYLWPFLLSKLFGKAYFTKRLSKLHVKNAYRLKKTILELKGLFIKIGQLVSILSSFLPEDFRKPLEDFQDKAPASPFEEVVDRIESELGGSLDMYFKKFEKTPIASASIGQVHRATLLNGQEVAVKIQHQHIPPIASIDLDLFERIIKIQSWIFDMKGMQHVSGQIRQMIEEELDYEREANNLQLMQESLKDLDYVIIPDYFPAFSSRHVLVTSFCEGTKINDLSTLESWGLNPEQIAVKLIELCCKMVLVDGLYHADPHPGNVHVSKSGHLILFDFGAISKVPEKMKSSLPGLIEGAAKGDSEEILKAMKEMGFVSKGKEASRFAEKLLDIGNDFLKNEIQMDGLNFKNIKFDPDSESISKLWNLISIRDLTNTFQVPKDYILLNRMLVLASGISADIAPQLNPLDVIRPYLTDHVLEGGNNWSAFIINTLKGNLTALLTIPGETQKVLNKAKRGELEIRLKGLDDQLRQFHWLGKQFLWMIICVVAGVLAYNAFQDNFKNLYYAGLTLSGISLILLFRAMWKGK